MRSLLRCVQACRMRSISCPGPGSRVRSGSVRHICSTWRGCWERNHHAYRLDSLLLLARLLRDQLGVRRRRRRWESDNCAAVVLVAVTIVFRHALHIQQDDPADRMSSRYHHRDQRLHLSARLDSQPGRDQDPGSDSTASSRLSLDAGSCCSHVLAACSCSTAAHCSSILLRNAQRYRTCSTHGVKENPSSCPRLNSAQYVSFDLTLQL